MSVLPYRRRTGYKRKAGKTYGDRKEIFDSAYSGIACIVSVEAVGTGIYFRQSGYPGAKSRRQVSFNGEVRRTFGKTGI